MTRDHAAIRHIRHDPQDRPFLVIWETTRACQLVCQHCRADAQSEADPFQLSTAEAERLLDDIAAFGRPSPMVVLTGGDPFERDDLVHLIGYGRERGLMLSLAPSVTPRASRGAFEEVRDAGIRAVSISLDGAGPETHDAFRGIDGVFDDTLDTCRTITDLGMRLQLNTTVSRRNLHELPAIMQLALELDAFLWSVFLLVPTGRGQQVEALVAEEVEDVLHWLADVANHLAVKTTEAPHMRRVLLQRRAAGDDGALAAARGPVYDRLSAELRRIATEQPLPQRIPRPPLDINAGRGFVFIDHVGNVQPSGFLTLPVGSVRERRLPELYRDAPLMRQLRDPDLLQGRCGRCRFRTVCGGSRSRAYATTGDPLAADPACAYEPGPDRDHGVAVPTR